MRVNLMNEEKKKINIHLVMFLYQIFKREFPSLKRVDIL